MQSKVKKTNPQRTYNKLYNSSDTRLYFNNTSLKPAKPSVMDGFGEAFPLDDFHFCEAWKYGKNTIFVYSDNSFLSQPLTEMITVKNGKEFIKCFYVDLRETLENVYSLGFCPASFFQGLKGGVKC